MVLPQENEQRRSSIGRADLMLAFPGFSRSGMRRIMVLPQEFGSENLKIKDFGFSCMRPASDSLSESG